MGSGWFFALAVIAMAAASCSNSAVDETPVGAGDETVVTTEPDDTADTVGTGVEEVDLYPRRDEFISRPGVPGVSDTEIRVGGLASATNPLQAPFGEAAEGAKAYFDLVNEAGGIYERDLTLAVERDDETVNNQVEVTRLLSQDDVFAVAPVSVLLFTGARELVDAGVPTFGWNIQEEFQDVPSMYGMRGYICITCPTPFIPWIARDIGATRIAVLAFGSLPQTRDCAAGFKGSFEKFPVAEIEYEDLAIPYATADYSVQVGKMKDAGVDLVLACMDSNAVALLAEEMTKQRMDAVQYIPNGYDADLVAEFAGPLEGSVVMTQFATFEVANPPEGLQDYLAAVADADVSANEQTLAGWVAADMLHTALLEAGPGFDQAGVIEAMNRVTDYDANGILPDLNWTRDHDRPPDSACVMHSVIVDGGFDPRWSEPGKPFMCFDFYADELPEPVLSD